jgi:CHAD domain-containing protein
MDDPTELSLFVDIAIRREPTATEAITYLAASIARARAHWAAGLEDDATPEEASFLRAVLVGFDRALGAVREAQGTVDACAKYRPALPPAAVHYFDSKDGK